jgi:endoglucanase
VTTYESAKTQTLFPSRAALIGLVLALASAIPAHANPPPDRLTLLRHGVNITNWFRFPPRTDAASIRAYLSDAAMAELRRAGFKFVRLAVQPEFVLAEPERVGWLQDAVMRLEQQDLGVIVELHPTTWHLETSDAPKLLDAWRRLGPALARFDPRFTFVEPVNEPVFPHNEAGWQVLQLQVLRVIRSALPNSTVVLTGNDWSSVDSLRGLQPVADSNVLYTVHIYDPAVLTSLAAYLPGLDRRALAALPFPVSDLANCMRPTADAVTANVMRAYCAGGWTEAQLAARVQTAADWATAQGLVVMVGEFGAIHALNAARLAWLTTIRQTAEQNGMGWALWGLEDQMGFDLPRPPGPQPRLDPAVLTALGLHPP